MSYYFSKTLDSSFDATVEHTTAVLKDAGFGIITEIDVKETFKEELGIDYRNYRILGACNPGMAFEALSIEDKVGTMLPCNVIVNVCDREQGVARPGGACAHHAARRDRKPLRHCDVCTPASRHGRI